MNEISTVALFRYSVLGPLVSRARLQRGELKKVIRELASRDYEIPNSTRGRIGEKTIESWYYSWRRGGIDALSPRSRSDRGQSKFAVNIQEAILDAKREKPHRSINQLILLMELSGKVTAGELSRSSVHRLLKRNGLSRPNGSTSLPEEYRSYEAEYAGDIWCGDVMHGPHIPVNGKMRKVYLVSLMDDASRLLTHTAFCTGEKALDIEGVLKQAILKRGVPIKLVVDNGPGYRSKTLQEICARLGIHLIYCRPYAPEGKGKLERWHRTVRDQFLREIDLNRIQDLADLNARLWAWCEQIYHQRIHTSLAGKTPLKRYQEDLPRIRTLGNMAHQLDEIFYHRHNRKVLRDGTVSYQGERFEVPYQLAGEQVQLVVDPHSEQVIYVADQQGQRQGEATPLDKLANISRKRRKPEAGVALLRQELPPQSQGDDLVETAYQQHYLTIGPSTTADRNKG